MKSIDDVKKYRKHSHQIVCILVVEIFTTLNLVFVHIHITVQNLMN